VDGIELVIYVFAPEGAGAGAPRPGIVFFHGGGWQGGDPAQFGEQCKYLARRGMIALTAEYRVRDRHGTDARKCVEDAAAAVSWTRVNAARLGIDPRRLAAGGGSAGGHLAACTGVCPVIPEADRPDALVLFNPALEAVGDKWPERFGGGEVGDVSPVRNVKPGAPPTLVMHGRDDETVPCTQAENFARAMTEAGNRCDLELYDGADHGFFNFARREEGFYELTLRKADRFLASLGWLEGEPEI
jgi:acetyl esterase/lipase